MLKWFLSLGNEQILYAIVIFFNDLFLGPSLERRLGRLGMIEEVQAINFANIHYCKNKIYA